MPLGGRKMKEYKIMKSWEDYENEWAEFKKEFEKNICELEKMWRERNDKTMCVVGTGKEDH